MSQIFSKDAQQTQEGAVIPASGSVELIKTNPLTPPFGSCKAVIKAWAWIEADADATGIELALFRNYASEALQINEGVITFAAAAGQEFMLVVMGADNVPDGRDVSYSLVATQSTAGGPSIGPTYAFVEAELISG